MSSLSTNWLKLNKLLDQYKKEDRDISVTICYNISWDSILLHAFKSRNNTAIHYATVTLPKVLSFPSSLAIFSSLEKCSLLLQALLELVCRAIREGDDVTNELYKCNNKMCLYYLKLQTNSPNVRRVCSVFCENLLEIATQVLELCPEVCSCVLDILKSALFHPSLVEDYTNLFRNKYRKTDHVQKMFSTLGELGNSENIQTLKSLSRSLPIIFKSFLTAYKGVQTNCKQFPISALNQFMSGIKLNSPQFHSLPLPEIRLECLSLLLEDLELHLRVFPNDPELVSAETATFSEILDQLILLYPLYPVETAVCMSSIQQIDHLLLQVKLRDVFMTVFVSEISSKRLLDCVFEVYCRLNQLDKLIVIIMRTVGEMENTLFHLPAQFRETVQNYFARSSLHTCNRCAQLLITGLQEDNSGVVVLSSMLSSIVTVSPVGDINTTLCQRKSFLQIVIQLHSLLQTYTPVRIESVLCYLTLTHGYLFVITVLNQLAFSRDTISSLQRLDVELMNWFIIPNVWVGEWSDAVRKFDKHAMKRIEEIQMNILLTLSRYPEYNIISISASEIQSSLSSSIEQVLSYEIDPLTLISVLQYSSLYIHRLTHSAMSVLSQQILTAVTNKQSDNTLRQVLYSSQFKELTPLHTYLCYNTMIHAVTQIHTATPLRGLVVEFYSKLIDRVKIDSHAVIREIDSILTSRVQRGDGVIEIELSSLAIIPLSHISLQLKVNVLIGLQVLLVSVTDRSSIQLIVDCCVVVLKGLKEERSKSKLGEYLCDMKQLILYIYELAIENTLDCLQLFTETCGILFNRNSEQFLSLTSYLITLWRVKTGDIPVQLYELTYAVIDRSAGVCEELRNAFNNLVEVTTPVLLKVINEPQSAVGHAMKLLSVNINYILLSHKQEASEQTEEAIDTIIRQLVNFIYRFDMNDRNTLQSLTNIADTLTRYSYSVDIQIDRISPVSTQEQLVMVVRWIGCSHVSSFKTFLEGENIELVRFCDILGRVVEGNVPDSHRREIRKSFSSILIKLTHFLTDRQLEEKDTLSCLNFLTAIFKLPNHIGLSSRSVVQGITCLTLLDAATNILLRIIHSKCVCLLHLIHNYSDCTISCIPTILLLTKQLIKSLFHLEDDTELPILTRLLESYTSLPPLSNYTHHLVQQYIVTSQEWPQKQLIKKTLKSSILALIGFSKPETLLSLQAQLDTTGRSFFKELKEEYDKFYRFKGKT